MAGWNRKYILEQYISKILKKEQNFQEAKNREEYLWIA